MFFEMRFDLGTLDSGERSLPFGLLVSLMCDFREKIVVEYMYCLPRLTLPSMGKWNTLCTS